MERNRPFGGGKRLYPFNQRFQSYHNQFEEPLKTQLGEIQTEIRNTSNQSGSSRTFTWNQKVLDRNGDIVAQDSELDRTSDLLLRRSSELHPSPGNVLDLSDDDSTSYTGPQPKIFRPPRTIKEDSQDPFEVLFNTCIYEESLTAEARISNLITSLKAKSTELLVERSELNELIKKYVEKLIAQKNWSGLNVDEVFAVFALSDYRPAKMPDVLSCSHCAASYPPGRFKCAICRGTFVHKVFLVAHEIAAHKSKYRFDNLLICSYCGLELGMDPRALASHIRDTHLCEFNHVECPLMCSELIVELNGGSVKRHVAQKHHCSLCNDLVPPDDSDNHLKTFHRPLINSTISSTGSNIAINSKTSVQEVETQTAIETPSVKIAQATELVSEVRKESKHSQTEKEQTKFDINQVKSQPVDKPSYKVCKSCLLVANFEARFWCDFCPVGTDPFISLDELLIHVFQCHEVKQIDNVDCSLCGYKFEKLEDLSEHRKMHHVICECHFVCMASYDCMVLFNSCDMRNKHSQTAKFICKLRNPLKSAGKSKFCNTCWKAIETDYSFSCVFCTGVSDFVCENELLLHLMQVHSCKVNKKFSCAPCNVLFTNPVSWSQHYLIHHDGFEVHQFCPNNPECQVLFSANETLFNHNCEFAVLRSKVALPFSLSAASEANERCLVSHKATTAIRLASFADPNFVASGIVPPGLTSLVSPIKKPSTSQVATNTFETMIEGSSSASFPDGSVVALPSVSSAEVPFTSETGNVSRSPNEFWHRIGPKTVTAGGTEEDMDLVSDDENPPEATEEMYRKQLKSCKIIYKCHRCHRHHKEGRSEKTKCNICPETWFVLPYELEAHNQEVHGIKGGENLEIICRVCKQFVGKSAVQMVKHTDDLHQFEFHLFCFNINCGILFHDAEDLMAHKAEQKCFQVLTGNKFNWVYKIDSLTTAIQHTDDLFESKIKVKCKRCTFVRYVPKFCLSGFYYCEKCPELRLADETESRIHKIRAHGKIEDSKVKIGCKVCSIGVKHLANEALTHRKMLHGYCIEHYACQGLACNFLTSLESEYKKHIEKCEKFQEEEIRKSDLKALKPPDLPIVTRQVFEQELQKGDCVQVYTCRVCNIDWTEKPNPNNKCTSCPSTWFMYEHELHDHNLEMHDIETFQAALLRCKLCDQQVSSNQELVAHTKTHHKFTCHLYCPNEKCSLVFHDSKILSKHRPATYNISKNCAQFLSSGFEWMHRLDDMTRVMSIHMFPIRALKCDRCSFERRIRKSMFLISCELCPRKHFAYGPEAAWHIMSKHNGKVRKIYFENTPENPDKAGKPSECDFCTNSEFYSVRAGAKHRKEVHGFCREHLVCPKNQCSFLTPDAKELEAHVLQCCKESTS